MRPLRSALISAAHRATARTAALIDRLFALRALSRRTRAGLGFQVEPMYAEALERRDMLAAFTPGDIVVLRVGTGGGAPLASGGNPIFID